MPSIPIIDLEPLWDNSPDGIDVVAKEVILNFKELGFAYVKNHNVSSALLKEIFQAAKDFHNLPREVKNRIFKIKPSEDTCHQMLLK